MYKRPIYQQVIERANEPRKYIQVLLGPRQVGKTTLMTTLAKELAQKTHYISADLATADGSSWLIAQWEAARHLAKQSGEALLIIDESQKLANWTEIIKKLWDEDTLNQLPLKVFVLGSSSWLLQKGLNESLAGRFEIIPITHWSYSEMRACFGWSLEDYIFFGGYPGGAALVDRDNPSRWANYINDSLIETSIARDILMMTQINKPNLLRRLFQLGCLYSGQVLSYQKMLGQLQDAGNTTTLAHYLMLLSDAGLLSGISKYAGQVVRQRGSSPRFMVQNTALLSAQSPLSYQQAIADKAYWGHLTESTVGAYLLNSIRGTRIKVFYWRERNKEVDFILQLGSELVAIEVKSGSHKDKFSGLSAFNDSFHPAKVLLLGPTGLPIEDFLTTPISKWFTDTPQK